jgi:hypothetical protein
LRALRGFVLGLASLLAISIKAICTTAGPVLAAKATRSTTRKIL